MCKYLNLSPMMRNDTPRNVCSKTRAKKVVTSSQAASYLLPTG